MENSNINHDLIELQKSDLNFKNLIFWVYFKKIVIFASPVDCGGLIQSKKLKT